MMPGKLVVHLSLQLSQTIVFAIIGNLRPAMFTVGRLQQFLEAFRDGFVLGSHTGPDIDNFMFVIGSLTSRKSGGLASMGPV
jgi:hypothetical protein